VRWVIDLDWAMTVLARAGYTLAQRPITIRHLTAFNEMQHQLFEPCNGPAAANCGTAFIFGDISNTQPQL